MGEVKEINIKKRTYFYFDDITDIRNFHSDLLKVDKKSYEDIDIYYIGYNTIKKFSNCDCDCGYENICSVNLLYLIIHSATGYFIEKNGEKYLIIDTTEKHDKVFSGIRSEIKPLIVEKKYFMKKIMLELELKPTIIYL